MNTYIYKSLLGKVITEIVQDGNDEIRFTTSDGVAYRMFHRQDCCEGVDIEDVAGDLNDLVGHPLLQAEVNSVDGEPEHGDSTWTYYRFATIRGSVTLRWYGESNGYYSTDVSLIEVDDTTTSWYGGKDVE